MLVTIYENTNVFKKVWLIQLSVFGNRVYPRSLDTLYIVAYYIKRVKTSRTYSRIHRALTRDSNPDPALRLIGSEIDMDPSANYDMNPDPNYIFI